MFVQLREGELMRMLCEAIIHRNHGIRLAAAYVISYIQQKRHDLLGKFIARLAEYILRSVPLSCVEVLTTLLALLADLVSSAVSQSSAAAAAAHLNNGHDSMRRNRRRRRGGLPHHQSRDLDSRNPLRPRHSVMSDASVAAAEAAATFWLCSLSRRCRYEALRVLIALRGYISHGRSAATGAATEGELADTTDFLATLQSSLCPGPSASPSATRSSNNVDAATQRHEQRTRTIVLLEQNEDFIVKDVGKRTMPTLVTFGSDQDADMFDKEINTLSPEVK